MEKHGSLLGGTLLIAGTTIGGGMLALPVLTCLGGFLPSLVIYTLCWLFMTATGLLFLEVSLWLHRDANIVSMAESTLGKWGKAFAWLLYIFLFYCLSLAYIVGCGDYIREILGIQGHAYIGTALFIGIFGTLVIMGTRLVSAVNGVLVGIMITLFFSIIFMGIPHINFEHLVRRDWNLSLLSLPVSFTAFAYQGTVPTLVNYLNYDVRRIRLAIIIGSFIPLVTYIIWQTVILGIVPTFGNEGLLNALNEGENAVQPLKYFIQNPWLILVSGLFAFIALLTSFFGVTLGLVDFLSDGLKIKKSGSGKWILSLLVFLPPFLISLWKSNLFLEALDLAGGYGCSLLLGLLPVIMVWRGRYHMQLNEQNQLPGGKMILILLGAFVAFEVAIQIMINLGVFGIDIGG
ncbi:MAG: aromatic amino acid transport family protein [Parachlamydiales bacterium]